MQQEVHPSLGHFSKLPYEIRELIWEELAPRGRDRPRRAPKADLSILRASRYLHDEITEVFHRRGPCLEFTISGLRRRHNIWSSVTTTHGSAKANVESEGSRPSTVWTLRSLANAKARGWYNVPFHKYDEVVVKMLAPDPEDDGQLFELWQTATELVEYFQTAASKIRCLTIRLEQHESHDWGNIYLSSGYDHDLVALPFCTLRNVEWMDVETHSDALEDSLDWTVLMWGMETMDSRSWNQCISANYPAGKMAEHDVDRKVAADYLWMYISIWRLGAGRTAGFMRRNILQQWFIEGNSGRSEFETRIRHIMDAYPEIIEAFDCDMGMLQSMLMVLVNLYHRRKCIRYGADPSNGLWNSTYYDYGSDISHVITDWNQCLYVEDLPAFTYGGLRHNKDILALTNRDIYERYLNNSPKSDGMRAIIREWNLRRKILPLNIIDKNNEDWRKHTKAALT